VFATWAFRLGIQGGDIPLGASVSLFMFPILAICAIFILRDINRRGTSIMTAGHHCRVDRGARAPELRQHEPRPALGSCAGRISSSCCSRSSSSRRRSTCSSLAEDQRGDLGGDQSVVAVFNPTFAN
jgi:hypothetical protein